MNVTLGNSRIYTSFFDSISSIKQIDPNAVFVAISGGIPDGYSEKWYKKLAPRWNWWVEWHEKFKDNYETNESKSWYVKHYNDTVLSKRNPIEVLNDLLNFRNTLNDNIYLLCFEDTTKFCHRHLIAQWLNENVLDSSNYITEKTIS